MSTKIYILLFIFIGNILYSQNIKIQYDIKYITDTIENNPETKTMVLYVTPQKKVFIDPANLDGSKDHEIFFNDDFTTVRERSTITKYFSIEAEIFSTVETLPKFEWIISDQLKKIDTTQCQFASLNYKGRKWSAWFSSDYPISTGPYIFEVLPGLIIEMYDSKNEYHFLLKEIKQVNYDNIYFPKALQIEIKTLKNLYLNYYDNPFRKLKEKGILYSIDENGNKEPPPNFDLLAKARQEYIRKNNNPIEISDAVKYNSR
ncbi:GLPGLI family protein [Kaistella sp.]